MAERDGVIADGPPAAFAPGPAPGTARAPRSALVATFLLLLGVCCLTSPGSLNAVDAWPQVAEAAALVDRGSVRFSDLDPAVHGPEVAKAVHHGLAHWEGPAEPTSKYGFGLHVLLVPAYLAARVLAALTGASRLDAASFTVAFVNPLATAAAGAFLLAALVRLGHSLRRSAWTVLVTFLGSFVWPLSAITYFDPVQTACVAAVLLQAVRARQSGTSADAWALSGLVALTVLTKLALAPLAAVLALSALRGRSDVRRFAIPAATSALGVAAAIVAVNTARTGDPAETGYRTEQLAVPAMRGLHTLLLSFDRGLLWFFPLLPAAVAGLFLLRGRDRALARALGAACLVHLALHVTYRHLHGGYCLGPRYLLPAMPLLAVGLAEAAAAVPGEWRRRLAVPCAVACVLWTAPMSTAAYFLVEPVRSAVTASGGVPREEPVPITAARLLASKGPVPPDEIPLRRFSSVPVDGSLSFPDRDNGGWQWWWVKPHPRIPAWARFSSALFLATLAIAGARGLIAACARGRPATDQRGAAAPAPGGASRG